MQQIVEPSQIFARRLFDHRVISQTGDLAADEKDSFVHELHRLQQSHAQVVSRLGMQNVNLALTGGDGFPDEPVDRARRFVVTVDGKWQGPAPGIIEAQWSVYIVGGLADQLAESIGT